MVDPTSYDVVAHPTGGGADVVVNVPFVSGQASYSQAITGLTDGTAYKVYVVAKNAVGSSPHATPAGDPDFTPSAPAGAPGNTPSTAEPLTLGTYTPWDTTVYLATRYDDAGIQLQHARWFTYTSATGDPVTLSTVGTVVLSTDDSDDTVIGVWDHLPIASTSDTPTFADDQGGAAHGGAPDTSYLTFTPVVGTTYYIGVGPYNASIIRELHFSAS